MSGIGEDGTDLTRSWAANAALLRGAGGVDLTEHDACGVGLVATLDGKPRREVVQAGIDALKAVWHRGAVDADGKTGDGAGITWDSNGAVSKSPKGMVIENGAYVGMD